MTLILGGLRRRVFERAGGCCEYCHMPERYSGALMEVIYIIPAQHGGTGHTDNLALICLPCSLGKGASIASVDPQNSDDMVIVQLFHPRNHRWSEHFRIENGRIEALTAAGRVTENLLDFNHPQRIEVRQRLQKLGQYPR